MILQVRHVSVVLVLLFDLSQRDMLRLGVDEMLDRFSPGVKHDCYKVGNLSVYLSVFVFHLIQMYHLIK